QRAGCLGVEALDPQRRQTGRLETALLSLADGEYHRDPFRLDPPSREEQGARRRVVQPLGVVDETHQRPFLRELGEDAEERERDEERIGARRGREPEGGAERVRLRLGQLLERRQLAAEELVEPGEGELGLGLDAGRAKDAGSVARRPRVVEGRALAHARFPAQYERSAPARLAPLQQPIERGALGRPAYQHGLIVVGKGGRHARAYGMSTSFPLDAALSSSSCARPASAKGSLSATTG